MELTELFEERILCVYIVTLFTGLSVIYLLLTCVTISVTHTEPGYRYILPVLPDAHYDLNDVIVLPYNAESVETTLVNSESSVVLATFNLTIDAGFNLGHGCNLNDTSIDSGVQIITSSESTVIIDLSSGPLRIPPLTQFGYMFYIFALTVGQSSRLIIQAKHLRTETAVNVCALQHNVDDTIDTSNPISGRILKAHNCTSRKISKSTGLLLNNISPYGIEISSDEPVGILEGHKTHLSSLVRNGRAFYTSEAANPPISWRIIQPCTDWSNQFILFSNEDRREVQLWMMSMENATIDIAIGEEDVTVYNITAKTLYNITVLTGDRWSTFISGTQPFSLRCSSSSGLQSCDDEIVPIKGMKLIASSFHNENRTSEYQWVYVVNDTMIAVVCHRSLSLTLSSKNVDVKFNEQRNLTVNNQLYQITYFRSLYGLYRLFVNGSMDMCDIVYRQTHTVKTANDATKNSVLLKNSSKLLDKLLNSSKSISQNPMNVTNNSSVNAFNSVTSAYMQNKITPNVTTVAMSQHGKDTSSKTGGINTTKTEIMPILKQALDTAIDNYKVPFTTESDRNTKQVYKDVSNDRFKAVVDFVQSKDGNINVLLAKSTHPKRRIDPIYIYKVNTDDNYTEESDGKNLLAVMVSLITALFAVGAIILVFLLKEFFSRKQQLRNTRIRPFVSYY